MRKLSFRTTVPATFVLLIAAVTAAVSILYYRRSSRAVLELADRIAREMAERIIERTAAFLESPASHARTLALFAGERDIVAEHERLWQLMWTLMHESPQVASLYVANRRGSYVQVRRDPDLATRLIDRTASPARETWLWRDAAYRVVRTRTGATAWDPRVRPWYTATTGEPRIHWSPLYIFTTARTPGITATHPAGAGRGPAAVCAVNISLASLSHFLATQKVSPNGTVLIAADSGELVAHPDLARDLPAHRVSDLREAWLARAHARHLATGETRLVADTPAGRQIAIFTPFPAAFGKPWKIVALFPEEDLLAGVRRTVAVTALSTLAILGAALVVVYLVATRISRPILALAGEMEKIRDFRLESVRGVESRFREVDAMSRAVEAAAHGLVSFRRYVPADLVRQLLETGREARLGGERAELTVFFSDIAGFTTLCERLSPEQAMLHLGEYLDHVTRIILEERGTVDKFIGDGVMAFWGAPVPLPDAPERACRAALRCQERIGELNRTWLAQGRAPLPTRIGVHTGTVIVGNLGTAERMSYSLIGDAVNLASRLEEANQDYGTAILVSDDTRRRLAGDWLVRPLDRVRVRGRAGAVEIHELLAAPGAPAPDEARLRCREFERARALYREKRWGEAAALFGELARRWPEDRPLSLFWERCLRFAADPGQLPADWDGSTRMA